MFCTSTEQLQRQQRSSIVSTFRRDNNSSGSLAHTLAPRVGWSRRRCTEGAHRQRARTGPRSTPAWPDKKREKRDPQRVVAQQVGEGRCCGHAISAFGLDDGRRSHAAKQNTISLCNDYCTGQKTHIRGNNTTEGHDNFAAHHKAPMQGAICKKRQSIVLRRVWL